MPGSYSLRVDWDGGGDFSPGALTGATCTSVATGTTSYLITTTADASDVPVGSVGQLYTAGGALRWDLLFTVHLKQSASGFDNIHVRPAFPAAPVNTDVFKLVTPNGNDVTERQEDTEFRAQYGRDVARSTGDPGPGEASFDLVNLSRDYHPENGSSPLAGKIVPGRPVRMQAFMGANSYTLFDGFSDAYTVNVPGRGLSTVSVTAIDTLARIRGVSVSTELHRSVSTGQAIGIILDEVGWPADKRDIDQGATWIPWFWLNQTDAFDALTQIVNSEGIPSIVYVSPSGDFVFRGRHHRLTRAASLTSQATFRTSGGEPRISWPITYDQGWNDIINSVAIQVEQRRRDRSLSFVWESDSTIRLADGETVEVDVSTSDPFMDAQDPVAGTTYTVVTGTVTASLGRRSGANTVLSFRATGGPATVTDMKVQAYSVPVVATINVTAEDSTSQAAYGRRSYTQEAPWAGEHDARALASLLVTYRAQRLPTVSVTLRSGSDTTLTQQLERDLSDMVTIIDTVETGLNRNFYIENISHSVTGSGVRIHTTKFTCEAAPAVQANPFRFDVAGQGFDDGMFGTGLDEPDMIFRFDVAGQGFDDGVFAT